MNAVEIEEAISQLADQPFDPQNFPYVFLEAFGNKETTIKQLKAGTKNKSDLPGGVLQINNIHLATCAPGTVNETFSMLRKSPATAKHKAKFILATDGEDFQAEDRINGDSLACAYKDFPNHFGFFLALAGISVVKQIREESFDIRATSKLNRLYTELLKDNPEWGLETRRHEMNHFLARLIFCFYAEDTHIFRGDGLFTSTIDQMSEKDGSNTAWVISEVFRAMNTKPGDHAAASLRPWASQFPYVNGGLFSGSVEVPRISKVARTYLLHIGNLDWKKINPDIFGSMIQAVADEKERGALGMHYTSRPNILKVLNPLFLDDLRAALEAAGNNTGKLKALHQRLSKIRVFDPACGSGNFLVIAYKELRALEAEIILRLNLQVSQTKSWIPLTNFRGIELRDFAAEIARLALIIAEYQCDVQYLGEKLALDSFLPLDSENWITQGNALRLDWLRIFPPQGKIAKPGAQELLDWREDAVAVNFQNEGGETYICGNPPYLGSTWQDEEQKIDLKGIFGSRCKTWKSLDYVAGWFMKAADYGTHTNAAAAFVSTNSICQGQQVPILWPLIFKTGHEISFAHTSFKWANLASHNAGVTVVIVGISNHAVVKRLFSLTDDGKPLMKEAETINPYLVAGPTVIVEKASKPMAAVAEMVRGNIPVDGGNLYLSQDEKKEFIDLDRFGYIRLCLGSDEFISGKQKFCLWLKDADLEVVNLNENAQKRLKKVSESRATSSKEATRAAANLPHTFFECRQNGDEEVIAIPAISSENREYLPVGFLKKGSIITGKMYGIFNAPLWNLALIASRLHWVWIGTVCVRMRTDFSYSNTLGWNTFPIPFLTQKNKDDLTRCAENILIERERHFPATIADLYDPKTMPEGLRRAHDWNDEVLERIYIGRRFKNDTERLEKLFEMYTEMTAKAKNTGKAPHHDVL